MKTTGVHDPVRGDMMRLPRESAIEASKHIARLKILDDSPWVPQQFIKGREYYTNWLVVNGQVKAFVACLSAEMLMHYEANYTHHVCFSVKRCWSLPRHSRPKVVRISPATCLSILKRSCCIPFNAIQELIPLWLCSTAPPRWWISISRFRMSGVLQTTLRL